MEVYRLRMKKSKKFDVIVPLYNAPYVGGTETVIRKWNSYFDKTDQKDVTVRFILPFVSREGHVLSGTSKNHIQALGLFRNEGLVRAAGTLFLLFYLIFTKTDNVIVLSPRYISLCHRIRRIFLKKYNIVSWIHFSPEIKFPKNKCDFLKADYHLAISSGIAEQYIEMGIKPKKIFVIYNPIDKNEHSIGHSSSPKYVYVGRLEENGQKNLSELLEGFGKLTMNMPDAELELWGSGPDEAILKKVVKEKGLSNSVAFKGWSDNPWKSIKSATAMVMTSKYEGLPMSILEAISQGLPVICSDVSTGPVDEINDQNGYLYNLGDTNQLRDLMIDVYGNTLQYKNDEVKQSIAKFYTNKYFDQLIKFFLEMEQSD